MSQGCGTNCCVLIDQAVDVVPQQTRELLSCERSQIHRVEKESLSLRGAGEKLGRDDTCKVQEILAKRVAYTKGFVRLNEQSAKKIVEWGGTTNLENASSW